MTSPLRINSRSGADREVTKYKVDRANDPDVEREQLNRVIQSLLARIEALEPAQAATTTTQAATAGVAASGTTVAASSTQTVVIGEGLVEGKTAEGSQADFTLSFLLGGM